MGEAKRKRRIAERDERIAFLMLTPPGETVGEQRARCAEYGRLVLERLAESKRSPLDMAIETQAEPHWWRDHGFIVRAI